MSKVILIPGMPKFGTPEFFAMVTIINRELNNPRYTLTEKGKQALAEITPRFILTEKGKQALANRELEIES